MNNPLAATPISPLRQRLIDDMEMRRFSPETKRNYIRDVGRFATFLGRSPDTATAEDLRRCRTAVNRGTRPNCAEHLHLIWDKIQQSVSN
jgi:hypothetical protein